MLLPFPPFSGGAFPQCAAYDFCWIEFGRFSAFSVYMISEKPSTKSRRKTTAHA